MSVWAKLSSGERSLHSTPSAAASPARGAAPFLAALRALGGGRSAGLAGSKKPAGRGSDASLTRLEIASPALAIAGLQIDARVAEEGVAQRVHALDLGGLLVADVGDELVQHRVERRAGLLEQRLDHVDRAAMVGDHQIEELAVERRRPWRRPARPSAPGVAMPFIDRRAAHGAVAHRRHGPSPAWSIAAGIAVGAPRSRSQSRMNRTSSFCEAVMRPATVSNCGFLVRDGASAAIVDRLLVMDDHHLHEGDVGGGEARVGDPRRLGRA